jgi:eukaryotic-like serine/threonine-protein kinase
MRPQVGQVINNKYRLLRLIGDGGMGSVYEARHEVLGTSVALKFLHAELGKKPGLVQRFLQEARVSALITSPHVVRVTDVDQTAIGAFIVMEYIEGKTLQTLYEDLYKAGVQLSYTDALEYAMQMLEGVEAAHKAGIVHRDLKPDNVMITLDGKGRALLKLLDFGIAKLKVAEEYDRKLTRPGVIMGTPEYMAPEQAFSADAVDARADIFSLGVMIFEMLAGRRPVGGEDPHQIATAYLSGHVARLTDLAPNISGELADAVHYAMAPLPHDRWPTVTAFRDAIEPFAFAARAPSALPLSPSLVMAAFPSPGSPSGSGILRSPAAGPSTAPRTPVTNVGALAGQGPVPKTLPPEDESAAPVPEQASQATPGASKAASGRLARADATLPADPPSMSDRPSRGPTPLGGFAAFGEDGEAAPATEPSAKAGGEGGARVPATRSAAPFLVGDPSVTSRASPLAPSAFAGLAGTMPALQEPTPRPNGTAVHEARVSQPPVLATPSFAVAPAVAGGARVAPGPATRRRGAQGALTSLPAILALAAAVSAAVVGGVYLAHRSAKTDDHEDPSAAPPPAAIVPSDPPPEDPSSAAPVPAPTPAHPWRPSTPYKPPGPKGSAGPVAPPAPSASTVPIFPPVLVIPSEFPFPFRFPPRQPADPRNQPDGPQRDRPAPRARPQQRDPGEAPSPPPKRPPSDDPSWQ